MAAKKKVARKKVVMVKSKTAGKKVRRVVFKRPKRK